MRKPRKSRKSRRSPWARGLTLAAALLLGGPAACGGAAAGDSAGQAEGKAGRGPGGKGDKAGKGGKAGGKAGGRAGEKKAEEALPVAVTRAGPAVVERFYRTSGTLAAIRSAGLVASQAEVILDLRAEEGDRVERGQLLARLDGRALELQASRDRVSATNAAAELERLEVIAAQGAASREELDKQRYAVEQALASVKVARHQVTQTKVTAPFAGTIIARHVDIGMMATQATPLFGIADLSQLDLDLFIPEAEATEVEVGSEVATELLDGSTFKMEVIRRAPVVDTLTGTIKFVARAAEFPRGAIPGAFSRAKVRVAAREAPLTLPVTALFDYEGKPHVYVATDGRARRRAVDLGLRGETLVEIAGGIDADALVIADAGRGLVEGMPVRPLGAGDRDSPGAAGAADAPTTREPQEDKTTDKNQKKPRGAPGAAG